MSNITRNPKKIAASNYFSGKKNTTSSSSGDKTKTRKPSIFAMEYYKEKDNYRCKYYNVRNPRDVRAYIRGERTSMKFEEDQWYKQDLFAFCPLDRCFCTPLYWHRNNLCIYCPELTCLIPTEYLGGMYNYMSRNEHQFTQNNKLSFKARGEYVPLGGKLERGLDEGYVVLNQKIDFNVLLSNYKLGFPRAYVLSSPKKAKGKDVWKYEVSGWITIGTGLDYPLAVLHIGDKHYEFLLCPFDIVNNLYSFVTRFGVGFRNIHNDDNSTTNSNSNTSNTKLDKDEFEEEKEEDKGKEKVKVNNSEEKEEKKKEEENEKSEESENDSDFESEEEEEEKTKKEVSKEERKEEIPDDKKEL